MKKLKNAREDWDGFVGTSRAMMHGHGHGYGDTTRYDTGIRQISKNEDTIRQGYGN